MVYYGGQGHRKLFDSKGSRNEAIEEGEICIVDDYRAQSNIDFEELSMPFVFKESNQFDQILKMILEDQESHSQKQLSNERLNLSVKASQKSMENEDAEIGGLKINIHGEQGIGKTRFVMEVARFLRYRYAFQGGIFMIDCSQPEQRESIRDLLEGNQQSLMSERAAHRDQPENLGAAGSSAQAKGHLQDDGKLNNQFDIKKDGILLIMDNCDDYVKTLKTQFILNLNYAKANFSNLSLILISQEMIDQKFNFTPIHIQRFDCVQSHIYIKQLKLKQHYLHFENNKEIVRLSQGNPSLLTILSLILQFARGKGDILGKIAIRSIDTYLEECEKSLEAQKSLSTDSQQVTRPFDCNQLMDKIKYNLQLQLLAKRGPRVRKNAFTESFRTPSAGFLQNMREEAFRKSQVGLKLKKTTTALPATQRTYRA